MKILILESFEKLSKKLFLPQNLNKYREDYARLAPQKLQQNVHLETGEGPLHEQEQLVYLICLSNLERTQCES